MAKTVGDLLIKLGIEGIEGVNVLKSSLTALGKAAGPTDKNIRKIRTEILEFANAGQKSTQAIRGVIESFKGLQAQASINSSVYKQLAADIEGLESTLTSLVPDANKAATAMERLKTIGFPSKAPDAFDKNMKARRQQLQGLKVDSEAYLNTLVGIRNFEAQQAARVARSEVSAAARVARTGMPSTIVQAEQPATLAALRLRIGEVQNEIENLDFTTKDYRDANRELIELQKSLSEALGGTSASFNKLGEAQTRAARRAEKLANIQQYYGTSRTGEGQAAQRAGGFRDPATGAMIARGTRAGRVSLAQQPMREISGLYRSIGDIGMSGIGADIDRMGKSVKQVTRDINAATAASNGSVNSLQSQRSALAQLRAGLDPTSQDFRELGVEIEKVDRRLEKLNKRRRRFTAKGFASGMAGVAAGGIFGGPEGAIGGAIGGAVGGIAGVAAGSAIGAQAKMLREALGATSDYAAELQKLEIALQGVAGAEYTDALKAANQVTKDFNVPIAVSTKGITRLSAAVVGAGGNIDDAEVVFRNITSAIKATGGGAQDVESAITAMVQTFSKGKVSAEELSGQLGERLPGAVTKFAEANNLTLPQLQKSLKAGTVGLDELMKFIISLGPEYEKTAREIADSSADAGARASVAFDQVRREVGEALQPIGAQLQKAFAKFVLDILPAIKGGAVAAASGLKALLDASAFLISNFKELLIVAGAAGVALALQNLLGIATALGTALGKATVAMKGFTAASLLNPWVALAAGITAATVALVKHSKKNAEFNKSVIAGETTNKEANDRLREMNDKVQELEDRLEKETNNRMIRALTKQLRTAKIAAGDLQLAMKLASSYEVAGIKYDRMTGRPINAPSTYTPHDYDDPDADPAAKGDTPMGDIELALRRQMRGAMATEDLRLQAHLQLALDLTAAKEETEDVNKRINLQEQAHADFAAAIKKIKEDELKVQRDLQASLEDRQYKLGLITEQEYIRLQIERERRKLEEGGASEDMIEKSLAALRQELDPDFFASINKALAEMQRNFDKLIDPANQVIAAATAIGDSFANSFKQVITGQASARQALASFFESVANHFADMAAKIIAEAIKMQAIKFITQIISAFIPTGGGNNLNIEGVQQYTDNLDMKLGPNMFPLAENAQGGYVPGGFKAFNQGGMVSQPTLGMVGEGGEPEYIIPQSKMRESMARYSRGVRGPGVIPSGGGATAASGGGTAGGGPIDVRYTVERINSVEYVTADQFQRGMQQAAAQGATQGERRALTTLRQNTSQRRRVGL